MTPEGRIERDIFIFLQSIGVFCWKCDRHGTFDPVKKVFRKSHNPFRINGVADILGIIDGRMLAIEVKSATGRLTDEQRVFLRRINEEGGVGIVGRSAKDVAAELGKHFPQSEAIRKYYQ
jgi:hypothetical protein